MVSGNDCCHLPLSRFYIDRRLWFTMALSAVITPVAMILELVICAMGVYAGYGLKKNYGYLFALTFLLFALFDYLNALGISADTLAVLNLIAILAALAGMYLVIQDTKSS
jgi:hypothetical protein